jgi:N-glycosylase/DNA lyase
LGPRPSVFSTIKGGHALAKKSTSSPVQGPKAARKQLKEFYKSWKAPIEARLKEFSQHYDTCSDEEVFAELAFCLFTPQSKALSCWRAVGILTNKDLLLEGTCEDISEHINIVRFRNHKAQYLVNARKLFNNDGRVDIRGVLEKFGPDKAFEAREWLVKNVKGLGYKEASHFLRNIGWGSELAILDRHILKNLKTLGGLREGKKTRTLTRKNYLAVEKMMKEFSADIGIPLDHLDLLLWCKETGEVFK